MLKIEATQGSEATHVALTGELDLASEVDLTSQLEQLCGDGAPVLLDLSGVSFMDSHGLHALVDAVQAARRAGRRIDLAPELTPQVKRLLQITDAERDVSSP